MILLSVATDASSHNLQTGLKPIKVSLTHEGHWQPCPDVQAQALGVAANGSGLAADLAEQRRLIEELRRKYEESQEIIAVYETKCSQLNKDVVALRQMYSDKK